jgi:hypothetical protein
VRDVRTEGGVDYATFREHGELAVSEIRDCTRTQPIDTSYDAKL